MAFGSFLNADLIGANMQGASLGISQFQGANLIGAQLHGARTGLRQVY